MRLFVAVWPPPEVIDTVAALPRAAVDGVRWTARDHWHVTLRFLGEVPAAEPVIAALEGAPLPATGAQLGDTVRRLGRGVLCIDVHGLDELAEVVTTATAGMGRPPESRPFHGHVTVARASRRGVDLKPLAGDRVEPHQFAVRTVAVVQSQLGRGGARYETLHEVPVSDAS